MDCTQKTVDDIRQILIKKYGYSSEKANSIKGKSNLAQEILQNEADNMKLSHKNISPSGEVKEIEEFFDKLETQSDSLSVISSFDENLKPTDPGWSEYVLGMLTDEEKQDGYPTMHGLRRLTEVLIGNIVETKVSVVMAPSQINGNYACVSVKVTVDKKDGGLEVLEACADASYANMDKKYSMFPVAIAHSRAESRVYARLLRVKSPSAEEIINEGSLAENVDKIKDNQIQLINSMCSKLGINLRKLLDKAELVGVEVEDLSYNQGVKVCQQLNVYQTVNIPDDIKVE